MAAQRGLPDLALPHLRAAVRAMPGDLRYHLSYIQALLDGGQTAGARRALRQSRRLGLGGPDLERLETALGDAERQFTPAAGEALFARAFELHRQGRPAAAAAGYRRALLCQPGNPLTLRWLGTALREQGWVQPAIICFQRALAERPDFVEALFELAAIRDDRSGYRRVLVLQADHAGVYANLGTLAQEAADRSRAVALWRLSLACEPTLSEAFYNLGVAFMAAGDAEGAALCYRRAVAIRPDHPGANVNEALCRLLLGDYAGGWAQYEWRWRGGSPDLAPRSFARPQWEGEPLAGRTLLVHAEQGYGDTLQFCRYLPLAAAASGARLVLEVQPPLKTLFAGFPGVAEVLAQGEPLPHFDLHCPMMSLPRVFKTTPETIPARVPYLAADPARIADWRRRLTGGRPRIGLCWAGNPGNRADHRRSLPLATLLPLVDGASAQWHVLQKDLRPGDAGLLAAYPALIRHRLDDFADTAALLTQLDLVITVCTSIAHLAGALGRPTWLLLADVACWRWFRDGEGCPWYPTFRLFRQTAPGDWVTVMERVAGALREVVPAGIPEMVSMDGLTKENLL